MRLQPENTELLLHENRPLRVINGRGVTIRCLNGIAWLTVAGEADDCFLTAGQEHRLGSDGLALVEAIGSQATIRLEPIQPGFRRHFSRLFHDCCGEIPSGRRPIT